MNIILFLESVLIGMSVFILSVNLIDKHSLPSRKSKWGFVVGSILVMIDWYIKY